MVKFRVRGVDRNIRDMALLGTSTRRAARRGVIEAAQHLLEVVQSKIGVYQQTGGEMGGRGRWKRLPMDTRLRKKKKYNVGDKPLYNTGNLEDSFDVVEGGPGTLAASVGSDSPYILHHVYGAPRRNVPRRDPIMITAVEETEECHRIVEQEIENMLNGINF